MEERKYVWEVTVFTEYGDNYEPNNIEERLAVFSTKDKADRAAKSYMESSNFNAYYEEVMVSQVRLDPDFWWED